MLETKCTKSAGKSFFVNGSVQHSYQAYLKSDNSKTGHFFRFLNVGTIQKLALENSIILKPEMSDFRISAVLLSP